VSAKLNVLYGFCDELEDGRRSLFLLEPPPVTLERLLARIPKMPGLACQMNTFASCREHVIIHLPSGEKASAITLAVCPYDKPRMCKINARYPHI
jgi:hypothetical protein